MTTRPAQTLRYLTPKRAEFLKHFQNFPYITTKQAYKILDAKTDSDHRGIKRFLKLLYEAGYLLREPVMSEEPSALPHWQFSYRLSKHGAKVVTNTFSAEKSPASLTHDQEITEFHMELGKEWNNGPHWYTGPIFWKQRGLKKTVYPDAFFMLRKSADGKTGHAFFLEIEKSRQGHYREGESGLEKKLRRYDEYRQSAKCKAEWGILDYRVIVIVKNDERKQNLLKKLAGILPYRFIWIATEEDYKRDIMGKIFHTPKDHTKVAYSFHDIA